MTRTRTGGRVEREPSYAKTSLPSRVPATDPPSVIPDLVRSISDPEHPLTLEQLAVVSAAQIIVTNGLRPHVLVEFTPTIPHCSMATLIGKLLRPVGAWEVGGSCARYSLAQVSP